MIPQEEGNFEEEQIIFSQLIESIQNNDEASLQELVNFLNENKRYSVDDVIQKNFIDTLLSMLASENNDYVDVALYILATFLLSNSLILCDCIINSVYISSENDEFKIFDLIGGLLFVEEMSESRIQSLLYCIGSLNQFIGNLAIEYIDFVIVQLHNPNKVVLKAAADVALSIVKSDGAISETTKLLIKELPYDSNDHDISSYCFFALEYLCDNGVIDCFEIPQILSFAQKGYCEAIKVIEKAARISPDFCLHMMNFINELILMLESDFSSHICKILNYVALSSNICSIQLLPIIPNLLRVYQEGCSKDKERVIHAISSILITSKIDYSENLESVCQTMIDALSLNNPEMIKSVLVVLEHFQYYNEELYQILHEISNRQNDEIVQIAQSLITAIDSFV